MTLQELKTYLVEECAYPEHEVDLMSDFELFDTWLASNGVSLYTEDIVSVLNALNLKNLLG